MENRRNYYRILQVQPDAPAAIIRASYRTLMQKLRLHPDLGGSHSLATLINEAYHTLSDPRLRAEYDQELLEILTKTMQNANLRSHQTSNKQIDTSPPDISIYKDIATQIPTPLVSPIQDARYFHRTQVNTQIRYFDDNYHTCYIGQLQDFSPGGLNMLTTRIITPNTNLHFESKYFSASGNVVFCNPNKTKFEIGVKHKTVNFLTSKGNLLPPFDV